MLTGTWEIEKLTITMNTYKNSDTSNIIEATADNWEQKMNSRNIRTTYNADGTYHSLHRDLNDSVFYDPAGTWKIIGDTLFVQDTFPARRSYRFRVMVDSSFAEFRGIEDFDGDGKADDEYYSLQRRIK